MKKLTAATTSLIALLLISGMTTGCTKPAPKPDLYTALAEEGVRLPIHLRVIGTEEEEKNVSLSKAEDILPFFKNAQIEDKEFTVWIHGEQQLKLWLKEFAAGGVATSIWSEEYEDTPESSQHTVYVLEVFPRDDGNYNNGKSGK